MNFTVESVLNFWNDFGDSRTSQWFLTKNIYPVTIYVIGCLFVLKVKRNFFKIF